MSRHGGGNRLVVVAAAAFAGLALGIVLTSGLVEGSAADVGEIQAPLTMSTAPEHIID